MAGGMASEGHGGSFCGFCVYHYGVHEAEHLRVFFSFLRADLARALIYELRNLLFIDSL
jgi:hypothetical protein